MKIARGRIEQFFYGDPTEPSRFTQDFPILPDVWMVYAEKPGERHDLLLTPHNKTTAGAVHRVLSELAYGAGVPAGDPNDRPLIVYNQSVVRAKLNFRELILWVLPLSDWWTKQIEPLIRRDVSESKDKEFFALRTLGGLEPLQEPSGPVRKSPLYTKLAELVGAIVTGPAEDLAPGREFPPLESTAEEVRKFLSQIPRQVRGIGSVWMVSRNRVVSRAVWRSRSTIKADAAHQVFNLRSAALCWAILDTGIDAKHPAFYRRGVDGSPLKNSEPGGFPYQSRVTRTYDFLRLTTILDPSVPDEDKLAFFQGTKEQATELLDNLKLFLKKGRSVEWDVLEAFLRVPHVDKEYKPPTQPHGSHVASILAGNWPEAENRIVGVCPEIELIDFRVLGENADEFTVIAALQFVRHLNAHKTVFVIHGVNMSMSMRHDVANYACGRTPVCDESERVVNSGVVVVAAAGNRGFSPSGADGFGDYRYISITDPGNADSVITVGSTHRYMPHTYGVSYFSSRGPTGDGRSKPDLVAPGEKIEAASLNAESIVLDGTSMAAPHVSGAAALLMARHQELIGQPARIKDILCKSATDLGREPRFQGAGLVDVFRAIQSV